jgi:hypothetical protein
MPSSRKSVNTRNTKVEAGKKAKDSTEASRNVKNSTTSGRGDKGKSTASASRNVKNTSSSKNSKSTEVSGGGVKTNVNNNKAVLTNKSALAKKIISSKKPSKMKSLAQEIYTKAGFSIHQGSTKRLEKLHSFLVSNTKNANKVFITTSREIAKKSKKYELIGRSNGHYSGDEAVNVFAAIAKS